MRTLARFWPGKACPFGDGTMTGTGLRLIGRARGWAGISLLLVLPFLVLAKESTTQPSGGKHARGVRRDRPASLTPPGKRWARVDLDSNEYVPVVAIQSIDREYAVTAMDTVRESMARYRD